MRTSAHGISDANLWTLLDRHDNVVSRVMVDGRIQQSYSKPVVRSSWLAQVRYTAAVSAQDSFTATTSTGLVLGAWACSHGHADEGCAERGVLSGA